MPKTSRFKRLVVKANNIIVKEPRVTFTAQELAFQLDISVVYARDIVKMLPKLNPNVLVIGGKATFIGEPPKSTDEDSATDKDKEAKDVENILKAKPISEKKTD
jgi:hypothetical protein